MKKFDIYTKISHNYSYNNMSNMNFLKPIIIWANTNSMLDEFYKRSRVNLTVSVQDNEIRNTMRHITGLGLAAREYGKGAYVFGIIKEFLDLLEDLLLHKPIGVISPEVWNDTITDFQNNHKGIQYMLNNPDATVDDLMNFAYKLAKENLLTKEAEAPILPEIKIPLPNKSEINEDDSSLQGHIEINVNKGELDTQGTPTGLAADLFSEEEIEELKERMKHERLPQETLKKMGEYHRRKFNERIKLAMTYEGDGSDITIANFVDKEGNFTFIPQKVEPTKPHPPVRNSKNSTSKGLSKDEKWQSFRKIFRTFFAIPDDDGKPMGKINSTDVYNAIDVMETMKKAMHESDVTQITDTKDSIKDSMQFEFLSDDVQTDMMQSALSQTSEQIKSDIKTEILDEISLTALAASLTPAVCS